MSPKDNIACDSPLRGCGCAWEGCTSTGEYRAPKDRRLQEYVVFCLEHIRAYNAKWDYHLGYSMTELEAEIRSAATWDRPTWKLGSLGGGATGFRPERTHVHDPFGFAKGTAFDPKRTEWAKKERAGAEHKARDRTGVPAQDPDGALAILQLTAPVTMDTLKRRYKVLVKRYHPDANGGSHEAETQMKIINQAYQTLRAALTVNA